MTLKELIDKLEVLPEDYKPAVVDNAVRYVVTAVDVDHEKKRAVIW